jgi:hypothetical protein
VARRRRGGFPCNCCLLVLACTGSMQATTAAGSRKQQCKSSGLGAEGKQRRRRAEDHPMAIAVSQASPPGLGGEKEKKFIWLFFL